jgi:hypothetical protein
MPKCDPSTLAVARAGSLLAKNTAKINEWNADGYTVRDREKFRSVVEQVSVDPSMTSASARTCYADGSRLVKPGAGPGGADVVIDDTFGSARDQVTLRLDTDGVWRAYDAQPVGATESTDVCPAA